MKKPAALAPAGGNHRSLAELMAAARFFENEETGLTDLEKIAGELADKIDAIKWVMDQNDAKIAAVGEWIDQLTDRKRVLQNENRRIKERVVHLMTAEDRPVIVGNVATARLGRTPGRVEYDCMPNEKMYALYSELVEVVPVFSWNKELVKEKLKAGEEVPHARLVTEPTLTFRMKGSFK